MKPLPPRSREPLAQTLLAYASEQAAANIVYDAVIVGSGYGGSVAGYQLSRHLIRDAWIGPPRPLRVLVLERGREFLPEDFPSKFGELPRELRVGRQTSGAVQGHSGLFDLRLGDDVNVLLANGLGGGSLINAGVMLEPQPAELTDAFFQGQVRALAAEGHYERARRWLGARVERQGQWQHNDIRAAGAVPLKVRAMAEMVDAKKPLLFVPPLTVALDQGPNFAGETLPSCQHCGDCLTGCRVGAKDSLDRNLLRLAQAHGVQLVTRASVTSLERVRPPRQHEDGQGGLWSLRVAHTDPALQLRQNSLLKVRTRRVILAAGTLGSTEILLRSRENNLLFSPRLGERFSCNGDNIGAVQGLREPVNGSADEDLPLDRREVGPTITTCLPLAGLSRDGAATRPFWLQEFSVPGALKRLFEETVTTARTVRDLPLGDCGAHHGNQEDPLAVNAEVMGRSLLVGSIGHDDAGGCLRLSKPMRDDTYIATMGAVRIHWPQAREGTDIDDAQRAIEKRAAEQPGRTAVANPMWRLLPDGLAELVSQPRGPVLTVHPLGGCAMGENAELGVVNAHGVVFNAGPDVYAKDDAGRLLVDPWQGSLRVLDGSIVPCSLGANPALTIAALASRATDELVADMVAESVGPPAMPTAELRQAPRTAEALCAEFAAQSPQPLPLPPTPLRRPPPTPPAPAKTCIRITERLSGPVYLPDVGHFQVELTLGFEEQAVAHLITPQRKPMGLETSCSRLRLYPLDDWTDRHLRALDDGARAPYLAFEAELEGEMRFLHRAETGRWQRVWHAGWAWFFNRGLRDGYQSRRCADDPRAPRPAPRKKPARGEGALCSAVKIASRAGEQRRFDYTLRIGQVFKTSDGLPRSLGTGAAVAGHKCITYNRRANPWHQLTRLQLTAFPAAALVPARVLKLDTRFIGQQRAPLLQITRQRDQAEALAELLSFGLYLLRVLLSVHLWTFRKPDALRVAEREREPQRLPGVIAGLPKPEVTSLVVGSWPADSPRSGEPLKIRLTRYRNTCSAALPPLVFIHGYSVSGNTFTHASLGATSAAEWFWRRGRDIWVLDLRTSTGLDSATWPWAMEDAGMVDLPAALLHVRNATGCKPDVFAHCIGCVMLSMALLGDPDEIRRGEQELGVNTFLSNEQLGVLAAFNGPARGDGTPHPTVGRVVLSQKGPVLRYTDDNLMRAAIMQYVRRWLLNGDYQFRASADPGVAEQLLDRLLSSLPYPDADYDVENPLRPCARTPWVSTRHRMDALYGRDFDAQNMEPAVLNAIDDLFGPINLDTVSQTIHFVLHDAVTNQRGRGEFVTQNRLRERWAGIRTLSMSGPNNGLVDPYTQVLLKNHLGSAGVDHHEPQPPLPQSGHQDVLIGRMRVITFDRVQRFFNDTHTSTASHTAADWVVSEPWVGPRLVAPGQICKARPADAAEDVCAPRVAAMSRPDRGESRLWLVPVEKQTPPGAAERWQLASRAESDWCGGPPGPSDAWLQATPDLSSEFDWLALLLYDPGEIPLIPAASRARSASAQTPATSGDHPAAQAVEDWLARAAPTTVALTVVRRKDLLKMRQRYLPPTEQAHRGLRFAVGSCQYASGLFDEIPAGASLFACLKDERKLPDMALWIGDQIYADATAGLLDPKRSDELYKVPHERALRLPGMRAVMQRMPTHMLLDDHELLDNWERLPPVPTPPTAGSARTALQRPQLGSPAAQRRRSQLDAARKNGLRAFLKYQRMGETAAVRGSADSRFACGGHAFLLLDTRSARWRGEPTARPPEGELLSAHQKRLVQHWFRQCTGRVKFIATPSALLPRRELTTQHPAHAAMSDAWCGFPNSLYWLLDLMLTHEVRQTVFLSGDEHHAYVAEAQVTRAGKPPLHLVSVHSSALYAPFPFANGQPGDLRGAETFVLPGKNGDITVTVKTWEPAKPGDGVCILQLETACSPPQLRVEFIGADGSHRDCWQGPVR